MTPDRRAESVVVVVALALVSFTFFFWRIDWPFDSLEQNLGNYFGPAARIWEHLGFAEVRGAPFWLHWPRAAESGYPYLNHPPGVFWAMYAFGTEEWALRLPGAIATWLGAWAMFLLLRDHVHTGLAFAASATFIVTPGIGVIGVGSYETIVVASGLWLWVAAGREGLRWRIATAVIAAVGPFTDWQFAFFGFGLVFLLWRRSPVATLRRLAVPASFALIGAGAVFGWRAWVLSAPFSAGSSPGVGTLITHAGGGRPALGEWLMAARELVGDVAGWSIVVAAIPGLFVLARYSPRIVLALGTVGLSAPLAFSQHALSHGVYYVLSVPLLVTCSTATWAAVGARWRRIGHAGAWLTFVLTCGFSVQGVLATHTNLNREIGEAMVARARAAGGGKVVLSDKRIVYLYYVDEPAVLTLPITDPTVVESLRSSVDATEGVVFLRWSAGSDTPLGAYLDGFESTAAEFIGEDAIDPPHPDGPRWVWLPRP